MKSLCIHSHTNNSSYSIWHCTNERYMYFLKSPVNRAVWLYPIEMSHLPRQYLNDCRLRSSPQATHCKPPELWFCMVMTHRNHPDVKSNILGWAHKRRLKQECKRVTVQWWHWLAWLALIRYCGPIKGEIKGYCQSDSDRTGHLSKSNPALNYLPLSFSFQCKWVFCG